MQLNLLTFQRKIGGRPGMWHPELWPKGFWGSDRNRRPGDPPSIVEKGNKDLRGGIRPPTNYVKSSALVGHPASSHRKSRDERPWPLSGSVVPKLCRFTGRSILAW